MKQEGGWSHLYMMNVEELEKLLWVVNFTNDYNAECYYDAYSLDVNPYEALYYLGDFIEWVYNEITDGFIDATDVWDWMKKLTARQVAEELYNYLGAMEPECHQSIVAILSKKPVKDTLYAFGEDSLLREILECWKANEKKQQNQSSEE